MQDLQKGVLGVDSFFHHLYKCFPFLVFGHFWRQSHKVTKKQIYYIIFVYILQGKMGKTGKNEKKITQLKRPKYKKLKDKKLQKNKYIT